MKRLRIAIVGRPNVGKSTLFNRLFGRRRALVHDEPGVTRDRLEENTDWKLARKLYPVTLIDTGGVGGERFRAEIRAQVQAALNEADVALFVFDGQTGLTPADQEILQEFQRSGVFARTRAIAVVNKVDGEQHESLVADFFSVGLEEVLTISAEHARGIDDLQAAILRDFEGSALPSEEEQEAGADSDAATESQAIRIAIVGRPNVGKSTIVNSLLGQERMITSPIAGTTVDSIDSEITMAGRKYTLIDTAGIRRKSKTEQGIEVLSVVQTRKALERADVAMLILDAESGLSEQDEKIGGLIEEVGCSVIIVMNKWDLHEKGGFTPTMAAERIRKTIRFLSYAPIVFVSARLHKGFEGLPELIDEVLEQRKVKIATKELTEWVKREAAIHNPLNAKFYMSHQSGRFPPTFVAHVSDPEKVHFSLRRHLVNALRERWGYMGTPIRFLFIEGKTTRRAKRPQELFRDQTRRATR